MTYTIVRPSPAMLRVTRDALAIFARHWPKMLKLAGESTDAGDEFVADYARACASCDHDAILEAARRWVAEETLPPRPGELGRLARQITFENRPAGPPREHEAPAFDTDADQGRITQLSKLAHDRLRSWPRVSEVWALLWQTATTPDMREHVRNGSLPLEIFTDALQIVATTAPRRAPNHLGVAV